MNRHFRSDSSLYNAIGQSCDSELYKVCEESC